MKKALKKVKKIKTRKLTVGNHVRVLSGTGTHPDLVGRIGVISHTDGSRISCVRFDNWDGGHGGETNDHKNHSHWYFANKDLELNLVKKSKKVKVVRGRCAD